MNKRWTSLAAILVLSACGGGGSDGVSPSAEGFWTGTTSGGYTVNLAILENGQTWGIYSTASSLVGAVYGNTSVSATSLSGSGTAFNFVTHSGSSGTYTGQFSTKSSISMTVSDGTRFTGNYDASYDQAVQAATIAGTYTGVAVTASITQPGTVVVIDSKGQFSNTVSAGNQSCVTTGSVQPRASGKNVYDLQLSFKGSYCALGDGATVSGVATYNSTTHQIIAMGLNSAKTDGLMFIGKPN